MRFACCLASVSMLTFGAVGVVSAARIPIYGPTGAEGAAYGIDPINADASRLELLRLMTDEGLSFDPRVVSRGTAGDRGATTYTDRSAYEAAVGLLPNIDFTGYPVGEILGDQYLPEGVRFADGNDELLQSSAFVEDTWGVDGNGSIDIRFTVPQMHFGVDFPGFVDVRLYDGDDLVWESEFGEPGVGHFAGVVLSGESFNRVIIADPADETAYIDTMYYHLVPEPGTIFLLGVGALSMVRRSKKGLV